MAFLRVTGVTSSDGSITITNITDTQAKINITSSNTLSPILQRLKLGSTAQITYTSLLPIVFNDPMDLVNKQYVDTLIALKQDVLVANEGIFIAGDGKTISANTETSAVTIVNVGGVNVIGLALDNTGNVLLSKSLLGLKATIDLSGFATNTALALKQDKSDATLVDPSHVVVTAINNNANAISALVTNVGTLITFDTLLQKTKLIALEASTGISSTGGLIALNSGTVPTAALDYTTKQYVDGLIPGVTLTFTAPLVKTGTTVTLTINSSYFNIVSSALNLITTNTSQLATDLLATTGNTYSALTTTNKTVIGSINELRSFTDEFQNVGTSTNART